MGQIDLPRLRADLRAVGQTLVELKRMLRTTWTEPMADAQRRMHRLKRRATELCVLRAHLRGRFHLADRAEWHAATADRVARDYVRSEEVR